MKVRIREEIMDYGGSTPFSTTSVQGLPGVLPAPEGAYPLLAPPLTAETRTEAVKNGVEPPHSIEDSWVVVQFELTGRAFKHIKHPGLADESRAIRALVQ